MEILNRITFHTNFYAYTGRSHFMPGLCSWKMSHKLSRNSHLKQCISWGLGDWQLHPIPCDHTISGHTDLYNICLLYIQYTYTSIQHIYLCLIQQKWKRLTSTVFHTVHCNRTAVVLLHKHFSSWLSTSCNSISIITNCMYANVMAYINNSFTSSSYLITSNFSSLLIAFCQFFTWIALGNVDLCFSLIWVTKTNAVEGETTSAAWLYHQCNQSIHMTDGIQWCHFLLATNTRLVWPGPIYAKLH